MCALSLALSHDCSLYGGGNEEGSGWGGWGSGLRGEGSWFMVEVSGIAGRGLSAASPVEEMREDLV